MIVKHRTTEQMLSDMEEVFEKSEASLRGMSVAELRAFRRNCQHDFKPDPYDRSGLIDTCTICGEGRA